MLKNYDELADVSEVYKFVVWVGEGDRWKDPQKVRYVWSNSAMPDGVCFWRYIMFSCNTSALCQEYVQVESFIAWSASTFKQPRVHALGKFYWCQTSGFKDLFPNKRVVSDWGNLFQAPKEQIVKLMKLT